jgi:outer membrane lipoprotein-sorting protein
MRDRILVFFAAAAFAAAPVSLPSAALGDEAAQALLEQVRKLNQTSRHWDDCVQRLKVTIRDRRGGERQREMEVFIKRYPEEATRTILFFRAPPEVRGIGFLQWVDPRSTDRQWLYLPELKRTRQITGTSRRESFVGTDFSYEDLALRIELVDWTDDDAATRIVAEEPCEDHTCAVIEFSPKKDDVSYGRIRLWLGRDDLVAHKYQFEDRNGRLSKTLTTADIRVVGNVPTAHRLEMQNERGGSRTVVVLTEVAYNRGLRDSLFTERHLERGS